MASTVSTPYLTLNSLPNEIIYDILAIVAELNSRTKASYTFGLSTASSTRNNWEKYVKAPIATDVLRWSSTDEIRQVCSLWHAWALEYALRDMYFQESRGPERWAELPSKSDTYGIYEFIQWPSGAVVNRNRMGRLEATKELLSRYPYIAAGIRRVCIHEFYRYSADIFIYAVLEKCFNMTNLTIPWTLLRRLDDWQWAKLLRSNQACALESLHIHAVYLDNAAASEPRSHLDLRPWYSSRVRLGRLKRLRLSGNTNVIPFSDDDLYAVTRTATSLRELYIDFVDTITTKGV